ncbi:MAG: hypothetical protein KDK48_02535 [Chlamydiia bacterium]|nr:hypothetical protein [Chlamydiia bacterium]
MLRITAYVAAIVLALVAISFLLWHAFDYQLLRIYSGPEENIELDIEESEDPAEFIKEHEPDDLSVALNVPEAGMAKARPTVPADALHRAKVLEAQSDNAAAEEVYRALSKEYSFDPQILYAYALFHARQGNFSRAAVLVRSTGEDEDPEGLALFLNCYERPLQCRSITTTTQGDWWTYLVEALAIHDLESAKLLIDENPYRTASWHPDLLAAVTYLVSYQTGRTLNALPTPARRSSHAANLSRFVDDLNALSTLESRSPSLHVAPAMRKTLVSREAFAFLFADSGLHEAAAKLHGEGAYLKEYPKWAALSMTRSLRQARGAEEALAFAMQQEQEGELSVEMGKLLLERGEKNQARYLLESLTENPSVSGAKAALVLAEDAYGKGALKEAKSLIDRNPRLATSVKGRELLARIALEEGDMLDADRLYTSIAASSSDAKSYFAKKALRKNNTLIAKKLTLELILENPSDVALRRQLESLESPASQILR